MSFQKKTDEIQEAIARGELGNLPGKGKPLDLAAYFATPEHLRMGYSILKSADIIPEQMELPRHIEGLKKIFGFFHYPGGKKGASIATL
jgi:Domain of unknown function (DUF1992)